LLSGAEGYVKETKGLDRRYSYNKQYQAEALALAIIILKLRLTFLRSLQGNTSGRYQLMWDAQLISPGIQSTFSK